ncbi:MAG: hypothetical protein QM811_27300 [Pirellulales bacterium]
MRLRVIVMLLSYTLAYAGAAAAEQLVPTPPAAPPVNLSDWTPRPATGKAEAWEKATDKDWIDARFRETDVGPFFNGTMKFSLGKGNETIYKATAVRLGEKHDAGLIFDRATMQTFGRLERRLLAA